jgi:hypothetical protein
VAQHLAESTTDGSVWGARFFARIVQDQAAAPALGSIIEQRNALAHGRQSLPLGEIKKLVMKGLRLESWEQIPEIDGELRLADWQPWIGTTGTGQIGLFERWQKNDLRYLVPETGEIFKVPRGSAVGGQRDYARQS